MSIQDEIKTGWRILHDLTRLTPCPLTRADVTFTENLLAHAAHERTPYRATVYLRAFAQCVDEHVPHVWVEMGLSYAIVANKADGTQETLGTYSDRSIAEQIMAQIWALRPVEMHVVPHGS